MGSKLAAAETPGASLSVSNLHVRYGHGSRAVNAVDDVTLAIYPGEVLGLVGESGSGKSSIARAIVGLAPVTAGHIVVHGLDLLGLSPRRRRHAQPKLIQMVFQDPFSSLNPRMTIGDIVSQGLRMREPDGTKRAHEAEALLNQVGLASAYLRRRPSELSGGERQRVAIARVLAVRPSVIVADEITSSLDVSVQAQILNLLRSLREESSLSMLFITHNLAVARYVSDRIAVMYQGRIVEVLDSATIATDAHHSYTESLLDSILVPWRTGSARQTQPTSRTAAKSDPNPGPAVRTGAKEGK